MKLKRILAGIIAASFITANTYAFTDIDSSIVPSDRQEEQTQQQEQITPEEQEQEQPEEQQQQEAASNEQETGDFDFIMPLKPKEQQYELFKAILDAYVENHLYDFSKEDVFYKFFHDFLYDNPMYFEYMMEYLLKTMDPYSNYYEQSSRFLEGDSVTKGFGFIIHDGSDGVYIEKLLEIGEAIDAGFMPGDKFVEIQGIDIEKQSFDIVSALLANPALFSEGQEKTKEENTPAPETQNEADSNIQEIAEPKFKITVDRNGEHLDFELAKGPMVITPIESSVLENNEKPTAYITVSNFLGDDMDEQFVELVKEYAQSGIKYLTIDLRDNGGGSLDYALAMAEAFIDNGDLICYYNDKFVEEPVAIYSTTDKVSFDSITILVNENSASAAELFTSILKDKGLAKVIGTTSHGKSLGQTVFNLANGDYITITTYEMLDTSLQSYDGKGIIPDIAIENVEMCYTLPPLGVFNHQNFVEIKEGQYSDTTKALEDRMVVMGLLREEYCDGIFDDITKTALYIFQKDSKIEATGYVNYETVSRITRLINSYKPHTYYEDSQLDVALIVHHSFSQGKRLAVEKERLREKEAQKIAERDAALEAAYEAEENNNKQ